MLTGLVGSVNVARAAFASESSLSCFHSRRCTRRYYKFFSTSGGIFCRLCADPIDPLDPHEHCITCLGLAYAEAAFSESDCALCTDLLACVWGLEGALLVALWRWGPLLPASHWWALPFPPPVPFADESLRPEEDEDSNVHLGVRQAEFRLSQMKDGHRKTIVVIAVIVAPNRRSCVVQWERFKDGRCHDLATKDSLRYSMIITQCVRWLLFMFTDQPINMQHEINAMWR